MSSMSDPSYGVHRDLLPHVHLISTYRYPVKMRIDFPEVTNWLMQAPKLARDMAPFYWTYLEKPQDGSVFLMWQPLQLMGTNFASDGYFWSPTEQYFTHQVGNGVVLEMYYHKAGFAYGDQLATHSRRRFRLIPPNVHNPNAPQVDPSLWIVHYGAIDGNEQITPSMIPPNPQSQSIFETRTYLHRCGQIQRKEFILGDRVNWPQIAWPREPARQAMYAGNRGVPQNVAYPTHAPASSGPPSKRSRTGPPAPNQQAMSAVAPQDSAYDDEEDTSRGDLFDHLTPREISLSRYRQNHEWMEEILSSPYRMGQIGFADLGLGLKGELSALTDGIFEAQGPGAASKAPSKPATTRLDPEKAEEFRKRVEERISAGNAEIEKMKSEHAKRVAKFKQNSVLTTSERELRSAVEDDRSQPINLDRRPEESEEDGAHFTTRHAKKVDEIVAHVESQLGRHAEVIHDLRRIQDGGYQEPAPEPAPEVLAVPVATATTGTAASATMSRQQSNSGSQHSGVMIGDSDIDMGGTAAGLLDQMHTGLSSNSTPMNSFPTPQPQLSGMPSNAGTPANLNVPSPQPQLNQAAQGQKATDDAKMSGMGGAAENAGTAPDQGTGSGEWVVIPKGGVSPEQAGSVAPTVEAPKGPDATSKQPSTTGTPAVGDTASLGFEGDHNDFSSLADLDTAGDALAGFGGTPGDLGDGLDIDMEDSAFGDAFHAVETGEGGDTPAEGTM